MKETIATKETKPFRILSIDGGGIRGILPARFLMELEDKLKSEGHEDWQLYHHFDLICGTSTGGIIAIALALGIPAKEIHELYTNKAELIFGSKKGRFRQIFRAAHDRTLLENEIREKFKSSNGGKDPILKDCKTNLCIPVFDLLEGKPSVLKTDHHPRFTRDFHIPAYQAALATGAAPVFFDPYSATYLDLKSNKIPFKNKVDGGVFANNPTLLGITEARQAFYEPLENLKVLSIGTGTQTFSDGKARKRWGIWYWINPFRKRLIDLFMQAQSQQVEHLVQLLANGIDKEKLEEPVFTYLRINAELDSSEEFELDETDPEKLKTLDQKAHYLFHDSGNTVINKILS